MFKFFIKVFYQMFCQNATARTNSYSRVIIEISYINGPGILWQKIINLIQFLLRNKNPFFSNLNL